jgi:hypothetical protein
MGEVRKNEVREVWGEKVRLRTLNQESVLKGMVKKRE